MEWIDGSSLEDAVKRSPGVRLQEADARLLFSQLIGAIDYIHQRRIVHRDVKVQNILVSMNLRDLKLIDFNTARFLSEGVSLTMTGTKAFWAPEVLLGEPPS